MLADSQTRGTPDVQRGGNHRSPQSPAPPLPRPWWHRGPSGPAAGDGGGHQQPPRFGPQLTSDQHSTASIHRQPYLCWSQLWHYWRNWILPAVSLVSPCHSAAAHLGLRDKWPSSLLRCSAAVWCAAAGRKLRQNAEVAQIFITPREEGHCVCSGGLWGVSNPGHDTCHLSRVTPPRVPGRHNNTGPGHTASPPSS